MLMLRRFATGRVAAAVLALGLGIAGLLATAPAAEARIVVGLGFGFPLFPAPYYYYPPPPVYYAPPPVYYTAPPAYYTAPPAAAYPAPATAPVAADQAGPSFTNSAGQTCREYRTTVQINGQPAQSYGTACLQPDGTWRIVN